LVMERLSQEEREAGRLFRAGQRRIRKANKAMRPAKVAPERSTKALGGLRERRPQQKDKQRLAWIRRCPCLGCARRGRVAQASSDAAHVRSGYPEEGWSYTGAGQKPDDARTVPFCRACHDEERDRRSEKTFWASDLDLYPPAAVARLTQAYEAGEDGAAAVMEIAAWRTDRG
jgi:cytochrome c553